MKDKETISGTRKMISYSNGIEIRSIRDTAHLDPKMINRKRQIKGHVYRKLYYALNIDSNLLDKQMVEAYVYDKRTR